MANCFEFTVSLRGIKPRIWRRFQLAGDAMFYDLHDAIQDSFGWDRSHMWEFRASGRRGRVLAGLILDDDWGLEGGSRCRLGDARGVLRRPSRAGELTRPGRGTRCLVCLRLRRLPLHWAHSVKLTRRIASPEGFHPAVVGMAGRRAGATGRRSVRRHDPTATMGERWCGPWAGGASPHRCQMITGAADSDGRAGWIVGGWTPDAFDLDAMRWSEALGDQLRPVAGNDEMRRFAAKRQAMAKSYDTSRGPGRESTRLRGYARFAGRCPYCGGVLCKSKIQLQIIMMV